MAAKKKNIQTNALPKHFHDTTALLREVGRFNVRPNFTGKKKGGRQYVRSLRQPTFG